MRKLIVLFFLAMAVSISVVTAQEVRWRNLSPETVSGRSVVTAQGSASFYKNGRYVWSGADGQNDNGRWQLLKGFGEHSTIILVTFDDGTEIKISFVQNGKELYLQTGRALGRQELVMMVRSI